MNTFRTILPLMFLACLAAGCCGHKEVAGTAAPNDIIFGSGGGITGQYTEYRVHNDGTIERKNFTTEAYEPYAKADRNDVLPLFAELDRLALQDVRFSHPGNMTKYIEVHDGTAVNRVKWGDPNAPVRPDIEAFFKQVDAFVRARKP